MNILQLQTDEIVLRLNGKDIYIMKPESLLNSGDTVTIPTIELSE